MSRTRPRLLIVAGSNELYGSDRCLLRALPAIVVDFDVTVAFPAAGPGTEQAAAAGASVLVLPDFALRRRHVAWHGLVPWAWRVCVALWQLHRQHRRRSFQMIYSNTLAAGIGPALRLVWGVPHVLHAHESPHGPRWLLGLLMATLRRTVDMVIFNSEHTRAFFVAHQPRLRAPSVVIHPGVDVFEAPPSSASDAAVVRIACVARVHPGKGHHILLEALRLATEAGCLWEVHFYGDALPENRGLHGDLERFIQEHSLESRVHWHGFVPDPYQLYGEADVVVVPSENPEGFSLVCVEAMMMGLPVVATKPGGPTEIILHGETGLLVPGGDAVALAQAIQRLAGDPGRRTEMGRAGRERALTLFTTDVFGARVREALITALRLGTSASRRPAE